MHNKVSPETELLASLSQSIEYCRLRYRHYLQWYSKVSYGPKSAGLSQEMSCFSSLLVKK